MDTEKQTEYLSDVIEKDGCSNCCGASVYDPSGEGEGICMDCHEHCEVSFDE